MAHVLVVDDDRNILTMLGDFMSERGHFVEPCRDGKQALDVLRGSKFDLILLDILLPNMNGFAVLEELCREPGLSKIPIVVFSGIYRRLNHHEKLEQYGQVIAYMDKPLNMDELGKVVDEACPPESPPSSEQAVVQSGQDSDTSLEPGPVNFGEAMVLDEVSREECAEAESRARIDFQRRDRNLTFQGSLADHSAAEVLGRLWAAEVSGALLLRSGPTKKIIYIKEGQPYSVCSNLVKECLGQLLVQERLISRAELTSSIREMQKTSEKQGKILVRMGSITAKNLAYALQLQFETKLYDCFTWDFGEYRFNPTVELPAKDFAGELENGVVVLEGVKRTFDESRLRLYLQPFMDSLLCRNELNAERSGLSGKLDACFPVDAPTTTRELLETYGLGTKRDELALLYSFICLRVLGGEPVESAVIAG
ncbi:MAG: response regulator [Myxococcota bacterium]|nr:response regulator [Myxococcota bacterium]